MTDYGRTSGVFNVRDAHAFLATFLKFVFTFIARVR